MKMIFEGTVSAHIRKSAHIYRQFTATVAAALLFVSGGINMGLSAVLFAQLHKDKTFPYNDTLNSLVASFGPLAMIPGGFVAGAMIDYTGRKISQIILSLMFIIGWIIMSFAYNYCFLLIGRFITGICFGATISSGMVFIAELADPKYRPIALICLSLSIYFGNLISHTVGKYVYWRYSCFLYVIPNVITLILLMFLKDSPLWLLNKGKIEEGIESFRLYRGNTESSENELKLVLRQSRDRIAKPSFQVVLKEIFSKRFWRTFQTAFLLFVAAQWNGVNAIPYYAEDIFKKTFRGDIDAFLLMIVSDCIRIIANITICVFATSFPRRLTFLVCCFINCFMLTAIAVYLYFRPTNMIWMILTSVIIYTGTGTAITSISYSTVAEIFPANIRGIGYGLCITISFILHFVSVKVTPDIINNYSIIALYGNFALFTFVSGIFLIFILQDTNSLTLQDIEDSLYKNKQRDKSNDIINNGNQDMYIIYKL